MKELSELLLMIILVISLNFLKRKESAIHQQNIQALIKEIYKFTNNLSPIINHMFQFRENSYNLRYLQQLASSTKKNY